MAVLVALALAPAALAGQGIWVTVVNKTKADLNLVSRDGSNCWEGQGLNHPPSEDFVSAGGTRTYVSEKKTGRGCSGDGHQNVQFMVKNREGRWILPSGSPPNYHLVWRAGDEDHGLNLADGLATWVPREEEAGLLCFHGVIKDENHADVYAYDDSHCNEAVPETITRRSPKPPASPPVGPPSAEGGGEGEEKVISVLGVVGTACDWYVFPKEGNRCKELGVEDPEKWGLSNLRLDIRKFTIVSREGDNRIAAGVEKKALVAAPQVSIPPEGAQGQLSVNESVGMSEATTSTTQRGFRIGAKLGFRQSAKAKIPFFSEGQVEFSQEVSGDYNWSSTDTSTRTQSVTKSVQISTTAKPGFTTQLEVFTSKRQAEYAYEADLDFGRPDDGAGNVNTPASVALGQSPAWHQPCLGYVVGEDKVRNSLVNIAESLKRAGYSPRDSSLSEARRAFLTSPASFRNGTDTCPGFPAGYSGSAGFNGRGVGTYTNLGYDANGEPVSKMVGCVYVSPYAADGPPTARTRRIAAASRRRLAVLDRATASASPCREVSIHGGVVEATPGVLVEDSNLGGEAARSGFSGPTANGTSGSDHIDGPAGGGTIRTGGGALDTVDTGHGDTRVYATARENIVQAQGGDDLLVGGGKMSYLYGGGGGDHLVENGGGAAMFGEGGGDTFEGHDMDGVMFGGGGGDRMIGTGDLSHLAMSGGAGRNVYVIRGKGTPAIVQLPGPGRSRVLTVHSLTVPPNVTVAEAIGGAHVTLRGEEARELIAGKGGATLIAGPEPARLRGGQAPDTFVFNTMNDDVATGGGGGDRFVFSGDPETGTRPAGLPAPADPSAPVVTDFTPGQGDRLVMRSAAFGRQVLALRSHFTVVAGPRPQPRQARPTLLLDTRDGLVSFDRDGTGPISSQVVVKLPGEHTLRRTWFEIAG